MGLIETKLKDLKTERLLIELAVEAVEASRKSHPENGILDVVSKYKAILDTIDKPENV